MNCSIDDGYLGLNEAAVYLGIKPVTLRKWLKSKPDLPRYQIGKLWKFKNRNSMSGSIVEKVPIVLKTHNRMRMKGKFHA